MAHQINKYMSQFTIIEDCSPYYIRFTHPGLTELVDYCKECLPKFQGTKFFKNYVLPPIEAINVLEKTPISKLLPLAHNRVSLFVSAPGLYYRAHKDGLNARLSINYTIVVDDDKCVTSWWDDDDLKRYPIYNLHGKSRECIGFNPTTHTPLKSMIASPGECILFNTEIFHDWDNRASNNFRVVLTLRIKSPLTGTTYFEDAKKIIFG